MTKATIHVPGLKVAVSLAADALPATWSRWTGPRASRRSTWSSTGG